MTTDVIESVHVAEESEENMTDEEGCCISRKHLEFNCRSRNIQRRPNASDGIWLCVLLPLALIINSWTYQKSSSLLYKVCGLISFGLFLQSLEILFKLSCRSVNVIANLAKATVVAQGLVVFLFGASVKVFIAFDEPPEVKIEEMTTILSVTLLGVFLLIIITYGVSFCRRPAVFLILLAAWAILTLLAPITDPLPVELVAEFIFLDTGRLSVLLIYAGVAGITGAFVAWKISKKSSTSVSVRKIFHLVIVIVYLIGIIFQCTMLFLLSGLVLALFIVFEAVRLVAFPKIAPHLEAIIAAFVDAKDAGLVAFTPIYLLAGCSLPLWLHPSPCDLTDSTTFTLLPLIAGVLSVGIGDTMAGVVGSKFGRHRLVNSQKTVEGTVANIASQLGMIFFLHFVGLLHLNIFTIIISFVGVIVNAIIEAKTDQVDNLFLPLVTFIIFSLRF
uniref:dolichol kinase n=1 Tax=Lutzomyia longipalpis TaxID=7200 RepID=A0A1B0CS04_LUTLO